MYNTTLNIRLTIGKTVCNVTDSGAPLALYGSTDMNWRLTTVTNAGCADNASLTFDGTNDSWDLSTQRSGSDGYTFSGAAADLDEYYPRKLDGLVCGEPGKSKEITQAVRWRPTKAANGSMPELSGEFTVSKASVVVWGALEGTWVGGVETRNGTFVVTAEGTKSGGLDANVTGDRPTWSTGTAVVPATATTSGAVKERWCVMAGLGAVVAMIVWL